MLLETSAANQPTSNTNHPKTLGVNLRRIATSSAFRICVRRRLRNEVLVVLAESFWERIEKCYWKPAKRSVDLLQNTEDLFCPLTYVAIIGQTFKSDRMAPFGQWHAASLCDLKSSYWRTLEH